MGRLRRRARFVLPFAAAGAVACVGESTTPSTVDAGAQDASGPLDAGPGGDASPSLGWVDFAISGCPSGNGSEASPCLGPSPLELQFTALTPAQIDSQVWSFGDGSAPETSLGPSHTFKQPGSYDIALDVDGPGGSAGRVRLAAVIVIPAPLGSPCETDSQCASADCACGEGTQCPSPIAGGMCMLECASDAECGGNLCIDLGADGDAPWQRTTCLPGCTLGAGDCNENASCQSLRGVDGDFDFGCFPAGLLGPIGASCRNADALLDSSLCASGECEDLGLRGMCTAGCEEASCPSGTACITPTSGPLGPICVPTCDSFACDADGELSCRMPGEDFAAPVPLVAEGYCTPNFS